MHSNDSRTVNCLSNVATGGVSPLALFFPRVVFPVFKNPPILPKKNSSIRHHDILVERSIIV